MGSCPNSENSEEEHGCCTYSIKRCKNYNIYKAYKCIQKISDEIKFHDIIKKDKMYLICTHSIQYFINSIEKFSKETKKDIIKQLDDDDPLKYNFDNMEFIDYENYANKNEFIIADKEFFEIVKKEQNKDENKSVIIDIDKKNKIEQIEFPGHKKLNFIKLDNFNLCYRFNFNIIINNNLKKSIDLDSKTIVEENAINTYNYKNPINYVNLYKKGD